MGRAEPEQFAAFAHDEFPAGLLLDPEKIADATCFLLSDRASAISGAHVPADGGQSRPTARTFSPDPDAD